MAITDLTGTTWAFDTSKDLSFSGISKETTFAINYTTNGKDYADATRSYGGTKFVVSAQSVSAAWENGNQMVYTTTTTNHWQWFYKKAFAITIHDGADATNAKLIAWLEANATQTVESEPTTITYNGTNTSVEAGQSATMFCSDKKMESDVVVVFGSNGSIAYNGTDTTVLAGQTAIMTCAGKKMLTDVVISV